MQKLHQQIMLQTILKAYRDRKTQNLVEVRIGIKGMTCKNCVRTIRKALLTRPGVKHVLIDLKTGVASVTYDSNQVDVPALHQIFIVRKGYFPTRPRWKQHRLELIILKCGESSALAKMGNRNLIPQNVLTHRRLLSYSRRTF